MNTTTPLESAADVEDTLRSRVVPKPRLLHEIWERRDPVPDRAKNPGAKKTSSRQIVWLNDNIPLAKRFVTAALAREEFLLVCDAAQEILRLWDDASDADRIALIRIRTDYAMALVHLGSTRAARAVLEPCLAPDFKPRLLQNLKADIYMQIGDIIREESHYAPVKSMRIQLADDALTCYRQALALDPERVNAELMVAAASVIVAEKGSPLWHEAQSRAQTVLTAIARQGKRDELSAETVLSTAVAHTILGDFSDACDAYSRLAKVDGVGAGLLADARYRSQFLAEAVGLERNYFRASFPPLQLVVFAGHQMDRPDTPAELTRFSPSMIEDVRTLIEKKLDEIGVRAGVVSACTGADLLFAEALQKRQGAVHVVLPWTLEDFREHLIKPFDKAFAEPYWTPRFDAILENAATVRELGQMYQPGSDTTWQYMTEVIAGIALNTARTNRLDVQPMALWDGLPGRKVGGCESFVEFWRQQLNTEPILLKLPGSVNGSNEKVSRLVVTRSEHPTLKQQVKSILFADIVGYSKLNERVIPKFIEIFLESVSKLVAVSENAPLSINTWGDAIYAVFDYARHAALFGLELAEMIHNREEEWMETGLYWAPPASADGPPPEKHPLNIRIGLHAGPVFIHYDPIVRRLGFTGAHVNRAARIEPITRPGEVYASEEFAALAELDMEIEGKQNPGKAVSPKGRYFCEYAGTMPLAKGYPGHHRIYRVLPQKAFAVEDLARGIHEMYCLEAIARGDTPAANSALHAWEELPPDVRDANWAQVADIPNKLGALGWELAPAHGLSPAKIVITDAKLEELSIREHDRWMKERLRNGWNYGKTRDNDKKIHPMLVPWDRLTEAEKQKDRDTVRNVPKLIEKAGFKVRRAAHLSAPV